MQPDGRLGEIWLSSPSKTAGYWQQDDESPFAICLQMRNHALPAKYLRTGDLGVVYAGELYVCGRIKDLIIIRDQNHYPQDLERTVQTSHRSIKPGCIAAVAFKDGSEDVVVILAEIRKDTREHFHQELIEIISSAVTHEHQLQVHAVLLLAEKSICIPKTTSD